MAIKLELAKAYDQVDWHYLCQILVNFSFPEAFSWLCHLFLALHTL